MNGAPYHAAQLSSEVDSGFCNVSYDERGDVQIWCSPCLSARYCTREWRQSCKGEGLESGPTSPMRENYLTPYTYTWMSQQAPQLLATTYVYCFDLIGLSILYEPKHASQIIPL